MRNIITDLENSDIWETQLIIAINFIYSKNAEAVHVMPSRSDKINLHLTMMQMKLFMKSLIHFIQDIKEIWKHQ